MNTPKSTLKDIHRNQREHTEAFVTRHITFENLLRVLGAVHLKSSETKLSQHNMWF